jgi:hypothetical protein
VIAPLSLRAQNAARRYAQSMPRYCTPGPPFAG